MSKVEISENIELARENMFVSLLMSMAVLQQLGATKQEIKEQVINYLYEIDEVDDGE